jgi:zinc finger protein
MTEDITACPSCKENALERIQTTINVPHFGETLLLTFKCKSCQYKRTEVLSLTEKPAQKFVFHVKIPDHLKVRIVKSSKAIVKIPEFQFESTPGPKAQGFIGSIETLLEQVETTLRTLMKWTQDEPKKHEQLLKLEHLLQKSRTKNTPFTVILEDPSGNSAILPDPPDTVEIYPLTDARSED